MKTVGLAGAFVCSLMAVSCGNKGEEFDATGTFEADEITISWISEKSEFTPKSIQTKDERENLVYAVKIAIKNDGYVKIGMYGEVVL